MKKTSILFLLLIFSIVGFSQEGYTIKGTVKDIYNEPMTGVIVAVEEFDNYQLTDEDGHFSITLSERKTVMLSVRMKGYKTELVIADPKRSHAIEITLSEDAIRLRDVVVTSTKEQESTLSARVVDKRFMFQNASTSFAKTLSKVAGISSMDIGAGFSKPIIRGLGFNRVVVVGKGFVQQNQQWGADHGLEIDQYDIEQVVVHKGPMSLQFGSDAMGGAIEILPPVIPSQDEIMGEVTLIGKSNNDLMGISVMNAVKRNKWYVKGRYTFQSYADYRLPADTVVYLNTKLPIYDKRLKNTAGREHNASFLTNYSTRRISSTLSVSNTYQKNGFFPGAHGFPNLNQLQDDGSRRNIDLPNNTVNHFSIGNTTNVQLNEKMKWVTIVGYQYNHRKEESAFHTHYNNQSAPDKDPDLELAFKLHTTSFNSTLHIGEGERWNNAFSVQASVQQNRIAGYNFLIPHYNQYAVGTYWLSNYRINEQWKLMGGARYDHAFLNIKGMYDNTLADYLTQQGYTPTDVKMYAQRAYDTKPDFGSVSASAGILYTPDHRQTLKINIGKSFRFPTANELASNGVHHGAFRHEQGNPNLKPEQGYQFDTEYSIQLGAVSLNVSPFVSYFSNYIYLDPQNQWSVLPHAGLIYQYKEAKALFAGAEYQITVDINEHMEISTKGQYVYNRNITDKYPLPFTPPFAINNQIAYSNKYKSIKAYRIAFEHQLYAKQTRIARNEEATKGSNLFNIAADASFRIQSFLFTVGIQAQNIFDTRYMNHLSFYRKLQLPEAGRNIQILLKIPFYKN